MRWNLRHESKSSSIMPQEGLQYWETPPAPGITVVALNYTTHFGQSEQSFASVKPSPLGAGVADQINSNHATERTSVLGVRWDTWVAGGTSRASLHARWSRRCDQINSIMHGRPPVLGGDSHLPRDPSMVAVMSMSHFGPRIPPSSII
jgi:hypothetical protein